MFTARQMEVLRVILTYAVISVNDINKTFSPNSPEEREAGKIDYNGELVDPIKEDEIVVLRNMVQG